MRARYYEACYIIFRPLLRRALEAGKHQELPASLQRICNICVTSAMRSIEAFDGIEDCQGAGMDDNQDPMTILIDWNENNIQLQKCLAPNLRGPAAHAVVAFVLEGSKEE